MKQWHIFYHIVEICYFAMQLWEGASIESLALVLPALRAIEGFALFFGYIQQWPTYPILMTRKKSEIDLWVVTL